MLHTPPIEGVVLRYGRLYGPGTWTESAARPAARCMSMRPRTRRCSRSTAGSGIYNIAEDDGAVAITKARAQLGFDPTIRLDEQ